MGPNTIDGFSVSRQGKLNGAPSGILSNNDMDIPSASLTRTPCDSMLWPPDMLEQMQQDETRFSLDGAVETACVARQLSDEYVDGR